MISLLNIKEWFRLSCSWPALMFYRMQLKHQPFCIISNDCYGGELYRLLNRPYNTPFVGLMIMAPCYLKLLSNLESYLANPLCFINQSMYSEMNDFRGVNNNYPLAKLKDIEIHFLHYHNNEEANATWMRRLKRIDYNNLRIKFCLGKDYANQQHQTLFEQLSFTHKVCVGPVSNVIGQHYIYVPNLAFDAAVAFKQSMGYVNLIGWLKTGNIRFKYYLLKLIGKISASLFSI